jgi:hypothetical protein
MARLIELNITDSFANAIHKNFRRALSLSGIELKKVREGNNSANYDVPEEWEMNDFSNWLDVRVFSFLL